MDFNLGDLKWENFFLGDATAMVVDTIKASPLTARSFLDMQMCVSIMPNLLQ